MITKAIIEQIISPYQARVRIPILDHLSYAPSGTSTTELNIATVCTLPNCYLNVQVGDIVFIGFEDNSYDRAVILGHLSREAMSSTYADVTFGNLHVNGETTLSASTQIGNITSEELSYLSGVRDNIQSQLDNLKKLIDSVADATKGGNA